MITRRRLAPSTLAASTGQWRGYVGWLTRHARTRHIRRGSATADCRHHDHLGTWSNRGVQLRTGANVRAVDVHVHVPADRAPLVPEPALQRGVIGTKPSQQIAQGMNPVRLELDGRRAVGVRAKYARQAQHHRSHGLLTGTAPAR